ncbi:LytTR family DNA-binding domain-containing protein [Lacrimispora saccharolytica]|uniref:Response regulator receiver protein n=1 Tax=Lacrimispora saccharolytica (strain ATCC 35040 / DSM 2544 / NRCC 2533 / WM1) TaxID=610130 RepID=D9R3D9_LACSW|nr:LytTR family DNA-binding domain-containing protein [Lacrimispora saccharolytica]ADL04888.1 response regulator receiver protein [[Clostridium] saccharolyticum WM1]QRV20903.1 LytTR family transcriptional regulator [Lacrimispora saccharolytica]
MRVNIKTIGYETEEFADLYIQEQDDAMSRLVEYLEQDLFRSVTLLCQTGDKICRISSLEIYLIETVKEKQVVHTGQETYELNKRLYELERLLPSNFIRISKSVIINIDKVRTYTPMLNGIMKVSMLNSQVTYISRKYLREVRDRILEVKHYD